VRATWAYTGGDSGLALFTASLQASGLDVPAGSRVLEIGCSEADWLSLAQQADPTLGLYGIDWRCCGRPGTIIHGDVLTHGYPAKGFDFILGVSSIEHIGLGHYSGDPVDVDGDVHTMQRVREWITDDGLVYLDVPYSATAYQVHGTEYRVYDDAALRDRLLPGWTVLAQHWAPKGRAGTLGEKPTIGPAFTHYTALWLRKC
jgi:hypothetical protein